MKRLKFALILLMCLFAALPAHGEQVREPGSYQYSPYGEPVTAVPAYTLKRSFYAADLPGARSLSNLRDAHVAGDRIYVLRDEELIILTSGFRVLKSISAYTDAQGNEVKLTGASGVTVDRNGGIYVSCADAGEILHFEPDGNLLRVIGRPDIKGFENVAYKPIKLAVDDAMRIYVVAQGMYEGMVELNPDGSFSRFFGVNKVTFSFAQYIWRMFATREQLQRQQLWLPTDFTNIAIDDRGFIYATIQDEKGQIIKRLNAKGENILRVVDAPDPNGDLWFNESGVGIPVGPSVFIAVDTNPYGVFICLDQKRSRVFGYNEDGRLLYIIGGRGSAKASSATRWLRTLSALKSWCWMRFPSPSTCTAPRHTAAPFTMPCGINIPSTMTRLPLSGARRWPTTTTSRWPIRATDAPCCVPANTMRPWNPSTWGRTGSSTPKPLKRCATAT